jgi:prolyl-tRNA synthetase
MGFELMKITDRREVDFVLGGTAEEMFVDIVRKYKLSYRDLPLNLYQFSMKFRDEMRARSGLLRVREFIMKDAYSFDTDQESFEKTYKQMANTYFKIFKNMGLETKQVLSDNGYIGGEYCHEFVVENPLGESKYFMNEDGSYCVHEDIAEFDREDINADETEKPFEIIDQPEWVQTMEDNEKHYKLPKARFLKNVVFKHRITGEIYIAVIRGDLEVNKTKLEHVLDAVRAVRRCNR